MSAAPSMPPPPPPHRSYPNGDRLYGQAPNGYPNGASPAGSNGRRPAPMPHIKDLQVKAEERTNQLSPNITMGHLLTVGEQATKAAQTLVEYRRPDLAYIEYLAAMEIVSRIIPRHKDAVVLRQERGSMHRLNKDLAKRLSAMSDQFDSIKAIIENDNRRSGIQPTFGPSSGEATHQRPSTAMGMHDRESQPSSQRSSLNGLPQKSPRPSSYVEPEAGMSTFYRPDTPDDGLSGRSTPDGGHPASLRPAIRPKPPNLHGTAVNGAMAANRPSAVDPLNERFARLRASGQSTSNGGSHSRQGSVSDAPSVRMPSPSEYSNGLSRVNTASSTSSYTSHASNSRSMAPPHPPKLPLDTSVAAALPKAPSPTYSPARNMPTPGGINPPRSTARSMVGTGGRSNSIASSISNAPPGADGHTDSYFPDSGHTARSGPPSRRKSVYMPWETQISAEKLYDYLKMFSVLVIDVRPREDFDAGHLFTQNIMCVEPAGLRNGMSADELQESLVLSPDREQAMFDKRDHCDLVVYYDAITTSSSFLQGPPRTDRELALKQLYDCLYEFNGDKPLQRPPILLMGGLASWAELLGQNALITSSTTSTKRMKASRPIGRVPPAGASTQLYVRKKRLRDYNPLDAEEERKWAERTRIESMALQESLPEEGLEDGDEGEEAVPIYRTTEEFLRRYPEVSPIEQQSMTSPAARQSPVPSYPVTTIPTVPSRPPPAVPPVAYRGAHEREPSAHSIGARGPHLASYVPQNEMPHNIRLPRTGLINFGATCYMNATIQCLNATHPLTRAFRTGMYRKYLQRENWKGSKGLLPDNFANLIQHMWKGDVNACRPSTFRNFCARLNREWGSDRQQDAKEFFDFLIDFLHEDLNYNWNNPPPHVLSAVEEQLREKTPKPFASKVEWARYSKREKSIISELFAGQHASRLRCTTCGTTSTTYEAFYSISVEIPRSGAATIEQCLQSYCAEEMLSGDEVWKCPKCKKEREATKQITLTRAPRYLVVHFKRFSASHTESARKVRTPIDFPLNGLDLQPFMLPPPTAEEVNQAIRDRGIESVKKDCALDETMTPPYRYNCYAVMRHIGQTLHSGHYVALVKDPGRQCWKFFNDDRVSDFDPRQLRRGDELQNEQAYIVFFERDFSAGR